MSINYQGHAVQINSSSVIAIEAPVLEDTQAVGATERATAVELAAYKSSSFNFPVLAGDSKTADLKASAARMGLVKGFQYDSVRIMAAINLDRRRLVGLCVVAAWCLAHMDLFPPAAQMIAEEQFSRLSTLDKKLAGLVVAPVTQEELEFIEVARDDISVGWKQAALRQLWEALEL